MHLPRLIPFKNSLLAKIAILLGANPDAIKMQQASAPQLDGLVVGARPLKDWWRLCFQHHVRCSCQHHEDHR